MAIKVTFHGACGIVTGSCYEVRTSRGAILIDCGMFQGTKTVKALNYGPFPFSPREINALMLTHAHLDHCGLMPKLLLSGFKGPMIATAPTAALLTYVLPDAGYVQEMEVARLNHRNQQRGRDQVSPIYTRAEADACARHVTPRGLNRWIDIMAGVRARYWDAGHILGSASVELEIEDAGEAMRLLFSGDIGPGTSAIEGPSQGPAGVDHMFVEATYGDRVRHGRSTAARRTQLRNEIRAGLKAGGMILVPAFAVERTQELLVDLAVLFESGELPSLPVFIDSPLAIRATEVFSKFLAGTPGGTAFARSNLRFVEHSEGSRALNRLTGGAAIIAGSGMCDAGRIRHHLKRLLSHNATTVLFVGFQAQGTLGRLLLDGVPTVRIEGEEVAVNARLRQLDDYSGHADQTGLLEWIDQRLPVSGKIFLTHAEEPARQALAARLGASGIPRSALHLPQLGETVRLERGRATTERVRARFDMSAAAADWHNRYAETLTELRRKLDALPNDKARDRLLSKVSATLER
jgi:metallo-beta-lactamase family protein